MSQQLTQALTANGAPFEFTVATVRGRECRVFKHATQCISLLYSALDEHADKDLAVYEGRRLSYKAAYQQAASLACVLQNDFAIAKGSRVAIAMQNSPEWLVSFIAVTALGGIGVLVNSRGSADEINYAITSTHCEALLLDEKTHALVANETGISKTNKIIFDLSKAFSGHIGAMAPIPVDASHTLPTVICKADDIALILFTSGTTGRPKGALLSHRGVLNALKANDYSTAVVAGVIAEKLGIDVPTLIAHQPQSAALLMFPLFHVSGCYSVFLTNLIRGGKLVILSRWDANTALKLIEQEKVTTFPGVPTMYWDLLHSTQLDQYDLSSLTSLSVAGQATPVALLREISKAFPNAMLGSGYGMTETNGVICMTHGEEFMQTPDSVGRVLAIIDIKIVTLEQKIAATGESGEICLRGATLMLGYDQHKEANKACLKDGWYHTGDVGYLDSDGKLYIVDRLTEMIITGGENVYCAEVERALTQISGVTEAVTFGLPDARLGERLVALVRLQEGSQCNSKDLLDELAQSLASYKLPGEMHIIDTSLEYNATGKVLKAQAKAMYQTLFGENK